MTLTERERRITAFLEHAGWGGASRRALAGDASSRRYERLSADGRRAVLMDDPPPAHSVRPYRAVAGLLADMGLRAPAVHAGDDEAGLLLLEDFGDRTFARALDEGAAPEPLYALATDALIAVQRAWDPRHPVAATLPAYDDERLIAGEAELLLDWYLPAMGIVPDRAARASHAAAWSRALACAHALPRTLVLRDFFPDNLMLLGDGANDRAGEWACGLLDFQDAVVGCCAYDLMSLLQDARRDVPPAIERQMVARYLAAFPALDPAGFEAGYTVLAAQRHAKVIGIFTRLAQRDGKPRYLRHMPRLWRLLERALAHPELRQVREWFDAHVPASARTTPSGKGMAGDGMASDGMAGEGMA